MARVSSSNTLTTVAITAALSAVAGSVATAIIMRRRRHRDWGGASEQEGAGDDLPLDDLLAPLKATKPNGIAGIYNPICSKTRERQGDDPVDVRGVTWDSSDKKAGECRPELSPSSRRRRHSSSHSAITHSSSLNDSTRSSRSSFISEEENYISETEMRFKGEDAFDALLEYYDLNDPIDHQDDDGWHLLRRTRAISALSHRLMAAPDEAACIEEVARLLALMFGLDRVGFAFVTGSDHFLLKRVNVKRKGDENDAPSSAFELECLDSDSKRPLLGTAAGVCVKTLKEHYTPRTRESSFETHRVFYTQGRNTVLVSPILVNGNKCAGCILLSREPEDGFEKPDRVLISDIGLLLGANVYAKRLLKTAEESKKRSREMLHSFIPPKVLQKIECYWNPNSDEFKRRKDLSRDSSLTTGSHDSSDTSGHQRSNTWFVAQSEWTDAEIGNKDGPSKGGIKEKIQLIKELNRLHDDSDARVIFSPLEIEDFSPTSRALYAENAKNGEYCY